MTDKVQEREGMAGHTAGENVPENAPEKVEGENSTGTQGKSASCQERPHYPPATVRVLVQPEEKMLELPRPKTARQLLEALGLREETALVAREGELLTPDRRIFADDELLVRKVTSSG